MRRTLTMAAAAAALLVPGGPLPVAEAGSAAAPVARHWTAREAQSFWTAERMAASAPLPPDPEPAAPPAPEPATASPAPEPAAAPAPSPSPSPASAPSPAPSSEPAGAAPTPPPSPSPTPSPTPAARPLPAWLPAAGPGVGQDFNGVPVVGRMFVVKAGGAYFCTASVVASPRHNLVLSAAHCLLGSDTRQIAFVPQYTHANPQPYGMFPVLRDSAGHSKIWIDPRYRSQGPDRAATLDVAFAQVGPDADGFPVEEVVGGNRLVTGAGYVHPGISLIGYPASAARPRLCVNRTTKFTSKDPRIPGSFLRIDCTGYPGGTSGGPFLARYDARTGTGDVVGVIGGWKTGGDTADTSYSSYFGTDIRKLYEKAVAGAKAG
ncbi:hypothetical protein [Streptomyces sp. ISL-94]|uniref:hypothetical protein n=1 Tax=Streptomyces sp. ISL-94 TaxID=2819190 RepID=UPI001BE7549B|nr:hypothetical protein [Streptomyces sp. ISL-94]MBT2480805.1 hypothetical protein [Streptomyces sp. ISL-94]